MANDSQCLYEYNLRLSYRVRAYVPPFFHCMGQLDGQLDESNFHVSVFLAK